MQERSDIEVECTDLSSRGWGIGREPGGRVVMVDGAIPGDRVLASVTSVMRRWAKARLVRLLRPSDARVRPRCRHFGECGGCSLQQMNPAAQRRVKTARIRQVLARTSGLSAVPVVDCVATGPDWNYRARMEFSATSGSDHSILGLHSRSGKVFPLHECHLPHPSMMEAAMRLAGAMRGTGGRAHQGGLGAGRLLRLDLRRSRLTGEILAAVTVGGPGGRPWPASLGGKAKRAGVASLVLVRPKKGRNGRAVMSHPLGWGNEEIWEEILGVRVPLAAGAFLQARIEGAEAIYGDVLDWLAHQHGPVLDLYAGCGVLSLLLAQRGGEVVAVERSPAAVAVARRAMARDGHTYHLHQGDSLGLSLQMIRARARFPGAVVNPPRCGLHPRLPEALAGLGVRRLAYISCDPATMARDLGRLGGLGFHTVQVTPYDLFTHTAGIEVVARLHRPPRRG